MLAQGLDPALFRRRARRLRRIKHKQRPGPPADLVIREVADAIRAVAIGGDQLSRERHHPRLGAGGKRVEPVKARLAPQFEIDDRRQAQHLRRQGPAAGAVEPPFRQPLTGGIDPLRPGRVERGPAVPDLAVLAAVGIAAVEGVDAEAEKGLAAGCHQPRDAMLGHQRPARRGRFRKIGAGRGARRRHRRNHSGERKRSRTTTKPHGPPFAAAAEAAGVVNGATRWCRRPSTRPCARSAGRRRPARSARPCRRCRSRGRGRGRRRSS